ncbi:hypothetical protein GCM10010172_22310 [Paractinoplanes ferrugineus]|uniref:LigA protein n=1 Tax=Paractinoplanes ferrugineus TaxID=113564 RepID=A0A919IVG1_9ACTN|nr:hypothetical protein [Actinoplanes ferrugineus]GIE08858.1 hypothetical protein Afe05nite_06980 [Actinoplanes ferrugineus]
MTTPEKRFRRLLALFPREHRAEYGEEMLGVLLADGRTGPGVTADLLRAAAGAQFRQAWAAYRDERWRHAAFVVQLFGSILLLSMAVRRFVAVIWAMIRWPEHDLTGFYGVDLVRTLGWTVAVAGVVLGIRLLGVAGAAAGLAGEIVAPFRFYLDTPAQVLNAYWIVVAAVVVLIAATVSVRRGVPRGWPLVVAAGAVLVGQGVAPLGLRGQLFGVAALLALIAVALVDPAGRRRVVVLAVPVLAVFPLVRLGFAGLVEYNAGHPESIALIDPLQWAVLVVVPVVAFVVAGEVDRRFRAPMAGTSNGA